MLERKLALSRCILMAFFVLLGILNLEAKAAVSPEQTGNQILPGCRRILNTSMDGPLELGLAAARCLGRIESIRDMSLFKGSQVCMPAGVTTGQVVAVVVKFMDANPQLLDLMFTPVALVAMQRAWPC